MKYANIENLSSTAKNKSCFLSEQERPKMKTMLRYFQDKKDMGKGMLSLVFSLLSKKT